MPYSVTCINCNKCTAPLVRKELIAWTRYEIVTNLEAKLALITKTPESNIVYCGVCEEIVGVISRVNNTYTIYKNKSFEFTYRKP